MYYWNGLKDAGQGICYATSPDLINWTYGGVCIGANANAWVTGYFLLDPAVIRRADGIYEMVFTRSAEQQIGYAMSYNGIDWSVYPNAILTKGTAAHEITDVGDPQLLEKPDGTCYLYYGGSDSIHAYSGCVATINP